MPVLPAAAPVARKETLVQVRTPIAAVCLTAALCAGDLGGCGSSDIDKVKFQKGLTEQLRHAQFTSAQIQCITDRSFQTFTQKQINTLYRATDQKGLPKDVQTMFTNIV